MEFLFKKSVLIFSSFVQTFKSVIEAILADSWYLLFCTFLLFLTFIFIFFLGYSFIHFYQMQNITYFKDKKIIGAKNYISAFKISDSLTHLRQSEVKNELLIQTWFDKDVVRWYGFSQDRSSQRQFPDSAADGDVFEEISTMGIKPIEMVEERFVKNGRVVFQIYKYDDNSIHTILPFQVIQELYELSVEDTQLKIKEMYNGDSGSNLHNSLVTFAIKTKNQIFENKNKMDLSGLSIFLKDSVESMLKLSPVDESRFKNVIYGHILHLMGTYQVQFNLDFSYLNYEPTLSDFFYLSIMNGTSNSPQDITPVIGIAKLACWLQVTISYFLLAFIVAILLKMLKLSGA